MTLVFFQYARKSSQGKRKQTASILDQTKILTEIRHREHLVIKDELSEAKSATVPDKRPVFRDMLDRISAGEANAILCWHTNRLYRNQKEYGEVAYLLESGVIQCIKTPEREYHPEDHALLMAVEAAESSAYVKNLRRDVKRGVIEKAEKGWYPFKPKAGYAIDAETKHLVVHPVQFHLLRRAAELVLSGTPVESARNQLNSWGYVGPRNSTGRQTPMTRSGMYRFLHDRFYTGEFYYRGQWWYGKHQPLLTPAEFRAIQRFVSGGEQVRYQKNRYAFTGLMRCAACGCQITAETHEAVYKTTGHSRRYVYYHCTGRRGCPKSSVSEADIETQILSALEGCRLGTDFVSWALSELDDDMRRLPDVASLIGEQQAGTIQGLKVKIDSLWEMRHGGEISADEFRERKDRYATQIRSLEGEAHRKASRARQDIETTKRILTFTRDAYDRFTTEGVDEKRQVARSFGFSYVLNLGTVEIRSHPALDRIRTFQSWSHEPNQIGSGGSTKLVSYGGDPGTMSESRRRELLELIKDAVANDDGMFTVD